MFNVLSNVSLALTLSEHCVAFSNLLPPLTMMLVYAQHPQYFVIVLIPHLSPSFEDWSKLFSDFIFWGVFFVFKESVMFLYVYLSICRNLF